MDIAGSNPMAKKYTDQLPHIKETHFPGSLIKRTAELLNNDSRTMETISRESGISYYWLKSFKLNPRPGSSATMVQKLYEFLTGKSLKV